MALKRFHVVPQPLPATTYQLVSVMLCPGRVWRGGPAQCARDARVSEQQPCPGQEGRQAGSFLGLGSTEFAPCEQCWTDTRNDASHMHRGEARRQRSRLIIAEDSAARPRACVLGSGAEGRGGSGIDHDLSIVELSRASASSPSTRCWVVTVHHLVFTLQFQLLWFLQRVSNETETDVETRPGGSDDASLRVADAELSERSLTACDE